MLPHALPGRGVGEEGEQSEMEKLRAELDFWKTEVCGVSFSHSPKSPHPLILLHPLIMTSPSAHSNKSRYPAVALTHAVAWVELAGCAGARPAEGFPGGHVEF